MGRISGGTLTFSTGKAKDCPTNPVVPRSAGGVVASAGRADAESAGADADRPGRSPKVSPPPRLAVAAAPPARTSVPAGVALLPAPSALSGGSGPYSKGRAPPSAMAASDTALAAANAKRRPRQGERSASRPTACTGNAEREAPPGRAVVEPWRVGR